MALIVTVMSIGRLLQARVPLAFYIPATWLTMTLVCGTVTAWGTSAGMPGMRPERRILWRGLGIAAAVSMILLPLRYGWIDPLVYDALAGASDTRLSALHFPDTTTGMLSVLLWSAGFQVLSLVVAPVVLTTRLTGRRWVGVLACITFRTYGLHRQLLDAGVTDHAPLFIALAAIGALLQGALFVTHGLVPTLALAAGMELHTFFGPPS
jgi:hypothetical protein